MQWLATKEVLHAIKSLPQASVTYFGTACQWTPYDLPFDAQVYALDAARLEVPSIVTQARRHLTVQLAQLALLNNVEGDFVEAGVYTGGTTVLMLLALDKYDPGRVRRHWAADSFQGLPPPVDQDEDGSLRTGVTGQFESGLDTFMNNVKTYNIKKLNKRMTVLEGWFNETLPKAPITKIAYLRLDGDLYVSTKDPLDALYDKVSPGGLIYIDDYGSFTGCRRAVDEFRKSRGIRAPLALRLQAVPDQIYEVPAEAAKWEAAWWVKPCDA